MLASDLLLLLEQKARRIATKRDITSRFRVRGYQKVISRIRQGFELAADITPDDIVSLGLTKHFTAKLVHWIECRQPAQSDLLDQLVAHIGIGAQKAAALIKKGLKSIDELQQPEWLSQLPYETQLDLKYRPTRRIPHATMEHLEPTLAIQTLTYETIMVGSYRRKTAFSKDIDVMLCLPNLDKSRLGKKPPPPTTSVAPLDDYLPNLDKSRLGKKPPHLDDYLAHLQQSFGDNLHIYSRGREKMSLLLVLPLLAVPLCVKIDVFSTDQEHKWSMLLYSTGSKEFNIRMRMQAKRAGLLLNQNGLYKGKKRMAINSEEGFFEAIGMPYVAPEQR